MVTSTFRRYSWVTGLSTRPWIVPVAAVAVVTESAARTAGAALSATASAKCKAARSTRVGERKDIKGWVWVGMRNGDNVGKKDGAVQVCARDERRAASGKNEGPRAGRTTSREWEERTVRSHKKNICG